MSFSVSGTYVGVRSQIATQPFSTTSFKLSSRYYSPSILTSATPLSATFPANELRAYPFIVSDRTTYSDISYHINTAEAAAHLRVGIYETVKSSLPQPIIGDLVFDSGEQHITPVGDVDITLGVGGLTLEAGLYWLAALSDNTGTAEFDEIGDDTIWLNIFGGDTPTAGSDQYNCLNKVQAYGALPDPFPAAPDRYYDYPFLYLKAV